MWSCQAPVNPSRNSMTVNLLISLAINEMGPNENDTKDHPSIRKYEMQCKGNTGKFGNINIARICSIDA